MNETVAANCYIQLYGNFQMLYLGLLFGFILLNLNMLIIITILRTKALHSNTNICIASVAVLDICIAMTDFTQGVIYSTDIKYNRRATNLIDTLYLGIGNSATTVSCTHFAIIAIDRYINIAHPFYYILNVTKRRLIALLFTFWLFGLAYCSSSLMFFRDDKYHIQCINTHPPLEYIILNAALKLADYIIMFTCYFKISHLAFNRKKAANARRLQSENPDNVLKIRSNRTVAFKSVKFFVFLFGTFFVLTFPQIIATGLTLLSYNVPENLLFCIFYLYDIHSVLNFVIYLNLNKGFSHGLKNLMSDVIVHGRKRCGDSDNKE